MRNRLRVLWLEDIHCQEVANNAVVKIGKHGSTNAILRRRLYVCGNYLLASGTKNNVLVKSNKVHIDKTLIFLVASTSRFWSVDIKLDLVKVIHCHDFTISQTKNVAERKKEIDEKANE